MAASIASEMRVIELENYHENITKAVEGLRVVQKPTPQPGPGQVLVRIEAAPCNPSDLVFMQGFMASKKPCRPCRAGKAPVRWWPAAAE